MSNSTRDGNRATDSQTNQPAETPKSSRRKLLVPKQSVETVIEPIDIEAVTVKGKEPEIPDIEVPETTEIEPEDVAMVPRYVAAHAPDPEAIEDPHTLVPIDELAPLSYRLEVIPDDEDLDKPTFDKELKDNENDEISLEAALAVLDLDDIDDNDPLSNLNVDPDSALSHSYGGRFDPYKAITYASSEYMDVDDEYIATNVHWKPRQPVTKADWKPKVIKDYKLSKRLYLDIETEGLDPYRHRIVMIGMMIDGPFTGMNKAALEEFYKGYIFEAENMDSDDAERAILLYFWRSLEQLNPEIIAMHNGIGFDLPFIARRMEILKLKHNIHVLEDEKMITAASMFGKPIRFRPVYFRAPNSWGRVHNDGTIIQVVDTMHLAAQVDKIRADMTSYSLKYLAHYSGGRTQKRLELTYEQMQEYWRSRDREKIDKLRKYLYYDLGDQKIVTDFFLPAIWYQQMLIPLPVQELCVASPARKWNSLLDAYYRRWYNRKLPNGSYYRKPQTEQKRKYEGALVDCLPGIYNYFFKIDVSSLYPSLILRYGLTSDSKDPMKVAEVALGTFRDLRYIFKGAAGDNPEKITSLPLFAEVERMFEGVDLANMTAEDKKKFKAIDGSLKVAINGFYGFLGVGGYPFNSVTSAALVTAYGRVLMRMMRTVCEMWCNIINVDTDGLCLQPKTVDQLDPELLDDTALDQYYGHPVTGEFIPVFDQERPEFVNPMFVWAQVQAILPEDILIDVEDNHPEGFICAPAMKNYVSQAVPGGKISKKGVYRKRNRSGMQKAFPIKYITLYAREGEEAAETFYRETLARLQDAAENGISDELLEEITFTQRIPKNNKAMVAAGIGKRGDTVSFYWAALQTYTPKGNARKRLAKFPIRVVITDEGKYVIDPQDIPEDIEMKDVFSDLNYEWYESDITKLRDQIQETVRIQKVREEGLAQIRAENDAAPEPEADTVTVTDKENEPCQLALA